MILILITNLIKLVAQPIHALEVKAKHLRVLFGRHNITDESERNWLKRNISEIIIHENYEDNAETDSDIAIYILQESLIFTNFIQPICMPSSNTNVFNKEGVTVGLGKINREGYSLSIPHHASLTSIDPERCTKTNDKGPGVVSLENSFCAKSDRSVPCQGEFQEFLTKIQLNIFLGDSGGPFMFENDNIWTIYGIVSYGFNENCDPNDYAVFVDVTKFVDWIYKNAKKIKIECGERKITKSSPLSIDGIPTYHGEHPWLASLQVKYRGLYKNICGASLINKWSLVTGPKRNGL